jgi:hypothetical protein
MEQQAREQAFITALVTEHFALQSARSATIGEANGRAAIYLSAVSSALVAFGFLAQVVTRLDLFVAAVLPALFILGEFTYVRLVANTIENLLALQQIQRIRGYYRGWCPRPSSSLRPRRPMRGWRRRWPPPACGRRGSRSCSPRPA